MAQMYHINVTHSGRYGTEVTDPLAEDPFDYQLTKSGPIRVSRGGRLVVTVGGREADRLAAALERAADEHERQLLLAKVTGNYKRGNERR
ncbi:hypothetical protein SAMN04488563_6653 [Jiangella alkaliphila]|uniref:Uncharacterized protein n=1 Tax=Jiangella alkaliphila TaxID=419479 RepID=A0A1H2LV22_9ACTN|nr:hypothetical protein SAMN04488563_6653 [Jiangella alkaliphila]